MDNDPRSPLARALGQRVPVKAVTVEKGRLRGVPLALRALSQAELQECRRAANLRLVEGLKWQEENLFTEAGLEDSEIENATQILALALVTPQSADAVSPRDAQRVAKDADELRLLLTKHEIALLWRIWCDYEIERSPLSTAPVDAGGRLLMSEAMEATLRALGEAQVSSYALHGYDTVTLRFIVTELAERLYSTPTNSPSSGTSPSSEPDDDSSETSDSPTGMTVE
ncbi:MAG: hypothetical protein Q8S73_26550 [Deltaproteobacteria bacterium]|nr:hypothetical protein [Myxococcales bacterium]MDP3217696.1 hypothetical protein [Deltaproteobacteria bacterium]